MENFTGDGKDGLHTPKAKIILKKYHIIIEAMATTIFKAVVAPRAEQ
jgi:hypothetical protein